jgi:RNA-directed DNA polymerase
MKVRYGKEVANHSGPESCSDAREGVAEALTGETGRPGIELRNPNSGMPTLLSEAEGNTVQGVNRQPCTDPTRSETLRMSGSLLHRSWEVSSAPNPTGAGGAGKVNSRNPAINADEKSDTPILPREAAERRGQPCGGGGGKGRSQRKHRQDSRTPDAEPEQSCVEGS